MIDTAEKVRVWDPFIRVFHWTLVLAWSAEWATAEQLPLLHDRLGYFLLTLVGLRMVWGLVGSRHARFADFVRRPAETLAYLRGLLQGSPRAYLGHNPAGGWMIVALLVLLTLTALSGIAMGRTGEAGESLHEALANLTLLLVVLHLGGMLLASLLHRENLVRAMFTGDKLRKGNDV